MTKPYVNSDIVFSSSCRKAICLYVFVRLCTPHITVLNVIKAMLYNTIRWNTNRFLVNVKCLHTATISGFLNIFDVIIVCVVYASISIVCVVINMSVAVMVLCVAVMVLCGDVMVLCVGLNMSVDVITLCGRHEVSVPPHTGQGGQLRPLLLRRQDRAHVAHLVLALPEVGSDGDKGQEKVVLRSKKLS